MTGCGTTPEIFWMSSRVSDFLASLFSTLMKDEQVYKVLMLLLRSPSEISIRDLSTSSDSMAIFSFSLISLRRSSYVSSLTGENLYLTHLDARGSMILDI